jgi:transmembrane sensor
MNETDDHSLHDQGRLSREAAEWLVKRDRGFTPAEQDAFGEWLARDPAHRRWLQLHHGTWRNLDALVFWKPKHSAPPNPDLLASPSRKRRLPMLAPLALLSAAALALFFWLPARAPIPVSEQHGGPRSVSSCGHQRLEDGSLVELKAGAEIAVDYTHSLRRVRLLRGEAYFNVAKNPSRPFVVQVGEVAVRAIGTIFNVRLEERSVEVLVTEGRVQVTPPPAGQSETLAPLVSAGQLAVVPLVAEPRSTQVFHASTADLERVNAWRIPLLEFDSTPLRDVVAEFNRYNQLRLIITDPNLAETPLVASFRADNVEGFVRLLEMTGKARVKRTEREILLSRMQ